MAAHVPACILLPALPAIAALFAVAAAMAGEATPTTAPATAPAAQVGGDQAVSAAATNACIMSHSAKSDLPDVAI